MEFPSSVEELQFINDHRCPYEKLQCLQRVVRNISEDLRLADSASLNEKYITAQGNDDKNRSFSGESEDSSIDHPFFFSCRNLEVTEGSKRFGVGGTPKARRRQHAWFDCIHYITGGLRS